MIDYFSLQTGSEYPVFLTVLYTLLFSFSLSSLIAFTYYFTTNRNEVSNNLLQTIILGAITASMVVQAIGDSVAIGLGVLGALAIIRFRTNFRNPRNIIFLFSALAVGIASGVYGFAIAMVGTFGFCAVAFVLNWSGIANKATKEMILRVAFNYEIPTLELEKVIEASCISYSLLEIRDNKGGQSAAVEGEEGMRRTYEYRVKMQEAKQVDDLVASCKKMEGIGNIKLEIVSNRELFEG